MSASCTKDDLEEGTVPVSGDETLLGFGFSTPDRVQITTRAVGEWPSQWRVDNLYICIFDAMGNRIYHRALTPDNKAGSQAQFLNDKSTEWWCEPKKSATEGKTWGQVRIKSPDVRSGHLYILANYNGLDMSAELLDQETFTEKGLLGLMATSTSLSLYRTELIMTGKASVTVDNRRQEITVSGSDEAVGNTPSGKKGVVLERIDAAVFFNVRVATKGEMTLKDSESATGAFTEGAPVAFRPVKWEVVNLPRDVSVFNPQSGASHKYYSTKPRNFETFQEIGIVAGDRPETVAVHGFSFYQMENLQQAKKTVGNYHDRERRLKNADGAYDKDLNGDIWEYAPQNATYVKISGQLELNKRIKEMVDDGAGGQQEVEVGQQLFADVVYYVHLGDFGRDLSDFSVRRNTMYVYNITIYGVDKITLEVNTSQSGDATQVQEQQPGATGDVYEADEPFHEFDAHYGQRVFKFAAEHLKPNPETGRINITWYVRTPFSEGSPVMIGDNFSAGNLDYKWVHFLRNRQVAGADGRPAYSHRNRFYPGDGYVGGVDKLMDVNLFTDYLKEQAANYWYNVEHAGEQYQKEHDFVEETFEVEVGGKKYRKTQHVIYFTIFVDEYFYPQHPVTGETDPRLWTKFVNCDDRMMHIISSNQHSLDAESSVTKSVVSLSQKSIETVFYRGQGSTSGWGLESVNERVHEGRMWFYSPDENGSGFNSGSCPSQIRLPNGKYSENGLYNTARILLLDQSQSQSWADMLDMERNNSNETYDWELPENDRQILRPAYQILRYAPLLRNRDNNGNGVVDCDDLQWYIASTRQLSEYYLGDAGVADQSRLYPMARAFESYVRGAREQPFREHIVSSTIRKEADVFWAEQGLSISNYNKDYYWNQPGEGYTVRCVRNLGCPVPHTVDDMLNVEPDSLIRVEKMSGRARFDMSNINRESLRHAGTRVDPYLEILDPSEEISENALLPLGFEVDDSKAMTLTQVEQKIGPIRNDPIPYEKLRQALERGNSICPPGWRVPNVREAAVLYLYSDWPANVSKTMVGTFYSLRHKLETVYPYPNVKLQYSWVVGDGFFTMDNVLNATQPGVRCVRDWMPDGR